MQNTTGNQENGTVLTNPTSLLGQIMAMPEAQRHALRRAWDALDGEQDDAVDMPVSSAGSPEEMTAWLASIQHLPKRQRLAMLDDALTKTEQDWEVQAIQVAIRKLMDDDAVFAIEVAVTRYAVEHPFMIVLGLVGFVLLGVGLAKGAWRLLF